MKMLIAHNTRYEYAETVRHSIQYVRLTPQLTASQRVLSWQLDLPNAAQTMTDGFGNVMQVMTIDEPHDSINIKVQGEVELLAQPLSPAEEVLSPLVFLRHTPLTQPDQAIVQFAKQFLSPQPTLEDLQRLMLGLLQRLPYNPGITQVTDSAADAFAHGQGVCQDHSHVFVACCRSCGIPARYVSGYIHSDTSEAASHAWAEAWIDGSWHTFDVSNGITDPHQHLRLAIGMDYLDACPVRGVRFGGGEESMTVIAQVDQEPLSSADQTQ